MEGEKILTRKLYTGVDFVGRAFSNLSLFVEPALLLQENKGYLIT
jgi:hypothetical protein